MLNLINGSNNLYISFYNITHKNRFANFIRVQRCAPQGTSENIIFGMNCLITPFSQWKQSQSDYSAIYKWGTSLSGAILFHISFISILMTLYKRGSGEWGT